MELELKITCTCHQANTAICCQIPLVAQIASKICAEGFFSMLNPNLQSYLFFDHSSNTSYNYVLLIIMFPVTAGVKKANVIFGRSEKCRMDEKKALKKLKILNCCHINLPQENENALANVSHTVACPILPSLRELGWTFGGKCKQ